MSSLKFGKYFTNFGNCSEEFYLRLIAPGSYIHLRWSCFCLLKLIGQKYIEVVEAEEENCARVQTVKVGLHTVQFTSSQFYWNSSCYVSHWSADISPTPFPVWKQPPNPERLQFSAPNERKRLKWGKRGDFSGSSATNNDVSWPHYFTAETADLHWHCQHRKYMQDYGFNLKSLKFCTVLPMARIWIWLAIELWRLCSAVCSSRISQFLGKDCLPIAAEGFPVDWS